MKQPSITSPVFSVNEAKKLWNRCHLLRASIRKCMCVYMCVCVQTVRWLQAPMDKWLGSLSASQTSRVRIPLYVLFFFFSVPLVLHHISPNACTRAWSHHFTHLSSSRWTNRLLHQWHNFSSQIWCGLRASLKNQYQILKLRLTWTCPWHHAIYWPRRTYAQLN